MSRNSTSSVGALHPVLFMILVYIVSVVLAFVVCRMIYFSIHGDETTSNVKVERAEAVAALR